jgi:hypothetical protein
LNNIEEYGTVLWVTTKNQSKFAAKTTGASETSLNNIAQGKVKINFILLFFYFYKWSSTDCITSFGSISPLFA